jgi:hypothetical protein
MKKTLLIALTVLFSVVFVAPLPFFGKWQRIIRIKGRSSGHGFFLLRA